MECFMLEKVILKTFLHLPKKTSDIDFLKLTGLDLVKALKQKCTQIFEKIKGYSVDWVKSKCILRMEKSMWVLNIAYEKQFILKDYKQYYDFTNTNHIVTLTNNNVVYVK